ncbi:MAG: TonB-dependent receptor [Chromatiaceae bacterium]|nr:MAG: TonB-dependent receptor [Chromatiaceae bacterium]
MMSRRRYRGWLFGLVAASTLDTARAAPAPLTVDAPAARSAATRDAELTVALPPLVVTATRAGRDPFALPLAIDALPGAMIQQQQPRVRVSEVLPRVPGTVVTNRGSLAQEEQIQLRGFGGRAQFGTRGVRLFADGIPASTPDGQGGPGLFALGSAGRIEVMRGAFSALYGNHSGGVVQVFTEAPPPRPTLSTRLLGGDHDTLIQGMKIGGEAVRERLTLGYLLDSQRADSAGYRDWSRARKEQLNALLTLTWPDGGSLRLVINLLDQPDNRDPLTLTAAQVAADRRQAQPAALAFRARRSLDNQQLGVTLAQPLGAHDAIEFAAWAGRRRNEQYLAIPLAAQDQITAAGGVSAFARDFAGSRLWWQHQTNLGGRPLDLTLGAEWEQTDEARRGDLNELGRRGARKRDETNQVTGWGAFLQGQWELAAAWQLDAGLRLSAVDFVSRDHFICTPERVTAPGLPAGDGRPRCSGTSAPISASNQNPDDSGSRGDRAWTPVLGLTYALTPRTNLYANLGRGFETPTLGELAYRPDGGSGLNLALRPARSWQWEIGTKQTLGTDGQLELALFQIDTKDELTVASSAGGRSSYRNIAGSRRRGAELLVTGPLGPGLDLYLAATWLDARWTRDFLACTGVPCRTLPPLQNTAPVRAGRRIPGVPDYHLFAELAWVNPETDPGLGLSGALDIYAQGPVAVDDRNSAHAPAYWRTGLRGGWDGDWRGLRLGLFARLDNLFDRDHIGAVSVNDANGRFYAPAPGRTWLLGLEASYTF